MQLHFKNLLHRFSSFRFTTYTRTAGFCLKDKPNFQCVARQNPPVLRAPESACSRTEQPLSADRGRKRSNTLDFFHKIVCQQGAFTPIGNPEVKEPAVPLQSQPF